MNKHIDLLGKKGRDRITGTEGVITSVCFDLFGCIQVNLTPMSENTDAVYWRDVARVDVTDEDRVMPLPDFEPTPQAIAEGGKGPAMKPVKR